MKRLKDTSLRMQIVAALSLVLSALPVAGQTNNSHNMASVQPVRESLSLYKSHDKLRQATPIKLAIGASLLTANDQNMLFTSNLTGSNPGFAPMHLELDPQSGFEISQVSYPRADMKQFAFAAESISVFKGEVPLRFSIRALPNAPLGKHTFTGRLVTQAIDNKRAYTPQNIPLIFTIEVVGPKAEVHRTHDPFVSPVLTPAEAALMPFRILQGIFIVLIDCPFNGNCPC